MVLLSSDYALNQPLTMILKFLHGEVRQLTPQPDMILIVKDSMETILVNNFNHFIVTPFNDRYLREWAFADWLQKAGRAQPPQYT